MDARFVMYSGTRTCVAAPGGGLLVCYCQGEVSTTPAQAPGVSRERSEPAQERLLYSRSTAPTPLQLYSLVTYWTSARERS
jgi:hypothetical protein